MGLFSFLNNDKTTPSTSSNLLVDIHSHLIYDVDDGATSLEDSLHLIQQLNDLGYQKLITTPHIMGDFYQNSKENLFPKRDIIRHELIKNNIEVEIECAAEYYLDETFIKKIKNNEELLSFGNKKYVLFETSFLNAPNQLFEVIFDLLSNGYQPILAHPERYLYLHHSFEKYIELKEKGVLFQTNINAISTYYSKPVQKIANKLIQQNLIEFLGTDCHHNKHIENYPISFREKSFQKAITQPLLNNSLL